MNINDSTIDKTQQQKGRMIFVLMLIFFIVPIIVVIAMYKLNWKPSGESLGDLINPPREMVTPASSVNQTDQEILPTIWKEKWSMVYVAEACEEACYAKLKDMRQLHVSLYKDIARAQRVLITNTKQLDKVKDDFPGMLIINEPEDAVNALIKQFKVDSFNPAMADRLYLVDPLGFLMMRYQSDAPPKAVLKDLKRLLKTSWAG
jgi:cytochrome oxidase Cu insertion factor (SCO1/SenC/PrrC family)